MDQSDEEKMQEIDRIIDSMPDSADEEFLCNLFSNVIRAYRFEKSTILILMMTAKIVSERMEELGAGETFH